MLGDFLVRRFNAFCRGAVRYCPAHPLPVAVRRAYLAPYASVTQRRAILEFIRDIPVGDADRSFPALLEVERAYPMFTNTPTLLVWGLRDFIFTSRFLERFRQLLPHAEVAEFAEAGHYLLEDRPELVLQRIDAFLDS